MLDLVVAAHEGRLNAFELAARDLGFSQFEGPFAYLLPANIRRQALAHSWDGPDLVADAPLCGGRIDQPGLGSRGKRRHAGCSPRACRRATGSRAIARDSVLLSFGILTNFIAEPDGRTRRRADSTVLREPRGRKRSGFGAGSEKARMLGECLGARLACVNWASQQARPMR